MNGGVGHMEKLICNGIFDLDERAGMLYRMGIMTKWFDLIGRFDPTQRVEFAFCCFERRPASCFSIPAALDSHVNIPISEEW